MRLRQYVDPRFEPVIHGYTRVSTGGREARRARGGRSWNGVPRRAAFIPPAFRPCAARRNMWLRTRRGSSAPPNIATGLQTGDARIRSSAAQPAGFGEFGGGEFGVAFEGIGGGEAAAKEWCGRIGAARFFEPDDRLVGARLQQMREPDPVIPIADAGIAGAEADGLLQRAGSSPLSTRRRACTCRERGNAPTQLRLNASAVSYSGMASSHRLLSAQHLAFGEMRKRIAGRRRQGLRRPALPHARDRPRPSRSCHRARGLRARVANRLCASTDSRIERQRVLEQINCLRCSCQASGASTMPHAPGECSPARRDARSAGRPPRRSARRRARSRSGS